MNASSVNMADQKRTEFTDCEVLMVVGLPGRGESLNEEAPHHFAFSDNSSRCLCTNADLTFRDSNPKGY